MVALESALGGWRSRSESSWRKKAKARLQGSRPAVSFKAKEVVDDDSFKGKSNSFKRISHAFGHSSKSSRRQHSADSFKSDFLTRLAAAELRDDASAEKMQESAEALDAMLFNRTAQEQADAVDGFDDLGAAAGGASSSWNTTAVQMPTDAELKRVAELFWESAAQRRQASKTASRSAYGSVTQVDGKFVIPDGAKLDLPTWLKLCALVTRPSEGGKEHTEQQQEGWVAAFRAMDPDALGLLSSSMVESFLSRRAAKTAAACAADEQRDASPSNKSADSRGARGAAASVSSGSPQRSRTTSAATFGGGTAHRGSVVLGALTSHLKRGPAMGETLERAVAARAELQANLDAHLLLKRRNEAALIALGQVERAASPLHALYALAHAFAPPIFGCEHASLWLIRQSKSRVADVVASRGRKRQELFHWPMGGEDAGGAAAAAADGSPAEDLVLPVDETSFVGATMTQLLPQLVANVRADPRRDVEMDSRLLGPSLGVGARSKTVLCVPLFANVPLRAGRARRMPTTGAGAGDERAEDEFGDAEDDEVVAEGGGAAAGNGSFKKRMVDGLSTSFKKLRAQGTLAGFVAFGKDDDVYKTVQKNAGRLGIAKDREQAGPQIRSAGGGRREKAVGVLMLMNKKPSPDGTGPLVPPFSSKDVTAGREFVEELGRVGGIALQAHLDAVVEQRALTEEAARHTQSMRRRKSLRKLRAAGTSVLGVAAARARH